MWKKIIIVFASILILTGLGFLLFPPISNFIGNQIANSEADKFDTIVENVVDNGKSYEDALKDKEIDEEGYPVDTDGNRTSDTPVYYKKDLDRLLKDSREYNENLKENQSSLLVDEYAYSVPSLNLKNYGIYNGIYGYVSAPTINMRLPIYLGANNANMSYGAAHLTYTSLPIGGDTTNTVLAGHTGYVGRIFFDNLRNLKIGDTVTLHNYWGSLDYRVTETKVCLENETQDVFLKEGKDLLTMITCISDGHGGFNRYYVICERK